MGETKKYKNIVERIESKIIKYKKKKQDIITTTTFSRGKLFAYDEFIQDLNLLLEQRNDWNNPLN